MANSRPLPPLTIQQHRMAVRMEHVVAEQAKIVLGDYHGLVDEEELHSEGKLALCRAILRYDETKSSDPEAHARGRVRGAMLRLVKTETRARKLKRVMQRAAAERMATYVEDFDVMKLRDKREQVEELLDKISDRLASAMWLAGANEEKQQASDDPEAAAEYAETIAALEVVLKPLPEKERLLLDLIFASSFNLEDAAEEMGVDRQTAWRRLQRVLEKLRRELYMLGVARAPAAVVHPFVRPLLTPRAPRRSSEED
jgi:RNA polymerase sigma factor (sigma-70 family)